jgi:hypothetical protein
MSCDCRACVEANRLRRIADAAVVPEAPGPTYLRHVASRLVCEQTMFGGVS